MIAMIDVLDDPPFDITEIFNELCRDYGFHKKHFRRINGLTKNIIIPENIKGVIISGSVHHIYDESVGKDWKNALCEFVKNYYREFPILGVCFGHEVIAHAMGGEVIPNELGREIGTVPIYTTSEAKQDALFNEFKDGSLVSQSHLDHVVKLPKEAIRLAYNDHSPNQAFKIGRSWGIQFHPELQPQLFKKLLSGRAEKLRLERKFSEANRVQKISDSVQKCPGSLKILKKFIYFCLEKQLTMKGN